MITEKIRKFNVNKSFELFKEIVEEAFPEREKCKICLDEIYYDNCKFTINRKVKI